MLINAAEAQSIKGTVYKKISSDRLALVLITNLKSNVVVMSDDRGNFSVKAEKGDTLLFYKNAYTPQKEMVARYDMIVYLQPAIQLEQVTIKGQTKKQELNDIMGAYRSKGLYYDGKPPITTFLPIGGSPVTGLYELFSKDAKNLRRFAAFAKTENEEALVNSRYNKQLVMRVTGATDSTASIFVAYYRPLYMDVKSWNDYELIKQVKKAYEGYLKGGNHIKLEKLY